VDGNDLCREEFADIDGVAYSFAGPVNGYQNEQLFKARSDCGSPSCMAEDVYINVNEEDRDGHWTVNRAPIIKQLEQPGDGLWVPEGCPWRSELWKARGLCVIRTNLSTSPSSSCLFEGAAAWACLNDEIYRQDLLVQGATEWEAERTNPIEPPILRQLSSDPNLFPDDGDYELFLTVSDGHPGGVDTAMTDVVATNVAPSITFMMLDPQAMTEGQSTQLQLDFTDPGVLDSHTLYINWDASGNGDDPLDALHEVGHPANKQPSGQFIVTHQYSDDNRSGTPSDSYTIELVLKDKDGDFSSPAAFAVTVANVPPVANIDTISDETGAVIGVDVNVALVGQPIHVAGRVVDVGTQDSHQASISWGDNEPDDDLGTVTGTTDAQHVYATPGVYTVTLTVTDDDTGVGTSSRAITVVDANGGITEVIEDLTDLLDDPGLSPTAAAAIQDAIDKVFGDDGALGLIEKCNLNAALVRIRAAIEYLEIAEAAASSLVLTYYKSLLALAAKSVVVNAIADAEAVATEPKERGEIEEAKELVTEGDTRAADGNYVGALEKYRAAVHQVQDILNRLEHEPPCTPTDPTEVPCFDGRDDECDDGVPCTVDTCDWTTGFCAHEQLSGFDRADCELERLVGSDVCGNDPVHKKLRTVIAKKVSRAQRLLDKARSTGTAKKANKFLKKCDKQLKMILKRTKRSAHKGKITDDCRAMLDGMITATRPLLQGLRE
jgi:PKD repeat protein